jgi:hypothetical protein
MSKETLNQASMILQAARDEVLHILGDQEHGMTVISIRSKMDQLINNLNFLSGTTATTPINAVDQFKPVTSFMGEPIETPKLIEPEQLTPQASERNLFLERVIELETQFPNMPNDKILDKYSIPEYQNVLRGVAKRAGLENYKGGIIDNQFIDDIRAAMDSQLDVKEQVKELGNTTGHPVKITPTPDGIFKPLD